MIDIQEYLCYTYICREVIHHNKYNGGIFMRRIYARTNKRISNMHDKGLEILCKFLMYKIKNDEASAIDYECTIYKLHFSLLKTLRENNYVKILEEQISNECTMYITVKILILDFNKMVKELQDNVFTKNNFSDSIKRF